jgi:hypothetical protein
VAKTTTETARKLARLSSDCSFLLTHLVRQNNGISTRIAKSRLFSILDLDGDKSEPCLKASSVGWYGAVNPKVFNPLTLKFDGPVKSKAVCFTESTLSGLKAHREIFASRYGIAFDRDRLFKRGANPCLNIRNSLLKKPFEVPGEKSERAIFNFIPCQLHPFINIIHESFDATHERERRYSGNLRFKYSDVLFVFCPEKDFPKFCSIQSSGRPVLFDLAWLDRV